MTNSSEKINQLKIDRNASAATGNSWKLPGIALAIVVVAVAGWAFLGRGPSSVLVETDIARKPPSAAAANSVLDASGYVVARQQATVSSKVTGKVVEVLVEEGMRVEQGQVLARLDDTTEQAQLALVVFDFAVTPDLLMDGLIVALIIGAFGGLFPAIRAARLPVA